MTSPAVPEEPDDQGQVEEQITVFEVAVTAIIVAALAGWLAKVASSVLMPFKLFGISPDPSAIWGLTDEWQKIVDQLLDDIVAIAKLGWETTVPGLPFNRDDPLLQDIVSLTRNLVVRVPDEVYAKLVSELSASVDRGETLEQKVQRVNNVLSMTGSENWPFRAKTISATEVNRAYSMGAFAAIRRVQANRPDLVFTKKWDSKNDAAVRAAHAVADRQTVAVNQPFIVDGEALMFPLDPRGKASNVINCRCRVRIERKSL